MAATVKIEFDDGSRIISQTIGEDDDAKLGGHDRSIAFSIQDFYEIPRTADFILKGGFRRVALQFPDALLPEAPEVLWALQGMLRKAIGEGMRLGGGDVGDAGVEGLEGLPLIFVTGDTSYGSCCVDEVSAQHLKADAIVHYGRACLSPTAAEVPVLYVFGKGDLDVPDLAACLTGPGAPLAPQLPSTTSDGTTIDATDSEADSNSQGVPVVLLYDTVYAHAIPALLKVLDDVRGGDSDGKGGGGEKLLRSGGGRLVVGVMSPQFYSSLEKQSGAGGNKTQTSGPFSNLECKKGSGAGPGAVGCGVEAVCRSAGYQCYSSKSGGEGTEHRYPPKVTEKVLEVEGVAPPAPCSRNEPIGGGTAQGGCCIRRGGVLLPSLPQMVMTPDTDEVTSGEAMSALRLGPAREDRAAVLRIGGLGVGVRSEEELRKCSVVFIGGEGRQLSNVLLRCCGCRVRVRYDPCKAKGERLIKEAMRGNRDLMRRYYLVQRAREANVVGIVVGTLGVRRYLSVVQSLRAMVEAEGRKAYVLAVGKINVAKLANFAEVEVFCLVACAENSLLDSREFHAPVVTPLELEVALGRREWDGFYSTDFDDLTSEAQSSNCSGVKVGGAKQGQETEHSQTADGEEIVTTGREQGGAKEEEDKYGDGEGDSPFFSLVTGTYKMRPGFRSKVTPEELGAGSHRGELVGLREGALVEWRSPAAEFLNQREFKGLEVAAGETEAAPATEGQSGIASDYGGF